MIFNRILNRITSGFARKLCELRGNSLVDGLDRGIWKFYKLLNNNDFRIQRNGELRVLTILSKFNPECILDVGANEGEWSNFASKLNPGCTIHAFEIVPETFNRFLQNTNDNKNIVSNNYGLSNENETITVYIGKMSKISTGCKIEGLQNHENFYTKEIKSRTKKASDYLKENNLSVVDFVKIDVEGMDLKVIKGFEENIHNVRAVQFEYGKFNISSGDLLYDFFRFFHSHGFVVGKIFPRVVEFMNYYPKNENFIGSNYLAVRSTEKHLIDELKNYSV